MTDSFTYDGIGKLGDAIAKLYEFSSKNNNRIAELIASAKAELGIVSKSKKLPDDVKLAIYQWHHDRLHGVNILSQPNDSRSVELISQPTDNDSVELYLQGGSVETISKPEFIEPVEHISHNRSGEYVEIISQDTSNDSVKIISQQTTEAVETFSQYRIAFYTTTTAGRKRQVIALDGFYLNALMLATGIDKKGVSAWVQQAVDGWPAFDAALPITRQVKYLLIRELTTQIKRLKNE